jgi:ATP-binding cassette subfamily G (WHITE) protein 2 (SNQ2)
LIVPYNVDRQSSSGVKRRELGVYFRDLYVTGVGAKVSHQATVGSMFNPKVIWEEFRNALRPSTRRILYDFNGVVRPGEMLRELVLRDSKLHILTRIRAPLVVLGSPGSGCTTFLKMLANQRDTYHEVQGDINYDSVTPKEIAAHYRGDVQYSPEDDVHFPTLTVEETIRFAAKTRTPHTRADGQTRDELIEEITDILTTVFGLRHVRKTLVGDAGIRGISGGEKKRVSISEALACRSLINCWDKYVTSPNNPIPVFLTSFAVQLEVSTLQQHSSLSRPFGFRAISRR